MRVSDRMRPPQQAGGSKQSSSIRSSSLKHRMCAHLSCSSNPSLPASLLVNATSATFGVGSLGYCSSPAPLARLAEQRKQPGLRYSSRSNNSSNGASSRASTHGNGVSRSSSTQAQQFQYQPQTGQSLQTEALRHLLPDGYGLEVLRRMPAQLVREGSDPRPPLLFVHGSYHAAWCWAEHFMPYFAQRGWDCYAVSMRCQGNSDQLMDTLVAGTLNSHAADLADLIEMLPSPPIIISHSFGGLIIQKYILNMSDRKSTPVSSTDSSAGSSGTGSSSSSAGSGSGPDSGAIGSELGSGLRSSASRFDFGFPPLAGAAFLCSTPPSGNQKIVGRFLQRDLLLSIRITWGFVTRSFARNLDACRELFFSKDLPKDDLIRYQALLAKSSIVRLLDLDDVNKQIPLPSPPAFAPPVFVLGAEKDVVVDPPAIAELAAYYKCEPRLLPDLAHDCMLDTRWEAAAAALSEWLPTVEYLPPRTNVPAA